MNARGVGCNRGLGRIVGVRLKGALDLVEILVELGHDRRSCALQRLIESHQHKTDD
jgi:hypothetical protein